MQKKKHRVFREIRPGRCPPHAAFAGKSPPVTRSPHPLAGQDRLGDWLLRR